MSRGFCTKIWYIGLFFRKDCIKLSKQLVRHCNQGYFARLARFLQSCIEWPAIRIVFYRDDCTHIELPSQPCAAHSRNTSVFMDACPWLCIPWSQAYPGNQASGTAKPFDVPNVCEKLQRCFQTDPGNGTCQGYFFFPAGLDHFKLPVPGFFHEGFQTGYCFLDDGNGLVVS